MPTLISRLLWALVFGALVGALYALGRQDWDTVSSIAKGGLILGGVASVLDLFRWLVSR